MAKEAGIQEPAEPRVLPAAVNGQATEQQHGQRVRHIAPHLLRDAMLRAVHIASDAGVFAILVHALSDAAKRFYLSRGFVDSALQPMRLMMTIATIREILTELE